MRIFTVLGIVFYATVLILIGIGLITLAIIFSFDTTVIQPADLANSLNYFHTSLSSRLILGLSGLLLILISFSFAQLILGRFQREKTIAFNTPSGPVMVALTAVEDLIRRLTNLLPEIKELRPDVRATKKGIEVDLRVVLRSEANIPEITSRLQEITKSKIQDVLGVEGEVLINIHIVKIVTTEEKDKNKKTPDKEETVLPFGGYTRV